MSKKNDPTLKEQIAELQELIAWFEQPEIDIEEALEKFKIADELARAIEQRMKTLENEITILKERFDQDAA